MVLRLEIAVLGRRVLGRSPACARWKLSWVTGAGSAMTQATAVSFLHGQSPYRALANGPERAACT
jgi:hypothetical protein